MRGGRRCIVFDVTVTVTVPLTCAQIEAKEGKDVFMDVLLVAEDEVSSNY